MKEIQDKPHRRFDYHSLADLADDLKTCGLELPLMTDTAVLSEPVPIGKGVAPNRLAVQPMEGCDGTTGGSPDSLTLRRYQRFASGGAGLIWVEATAVVANGRANPRQLWLHDQNLPDYRSLVSLIDRESGIKPYKVLQLTHSGRYSRPTDIPEPQIATANPWLDKPGQQAVILSDEQLAGLVPAYVRAAELAYAAGFDAVDIKACHRYLINELLSAHTRPGRYGGKLENRTRLLLDIVRAVRAAVPLDIAVRLNAYDEIPYPHGWGVQPDDHHIPDLTETVWLARQLSGAGVSLLNITGGNPYYNPHVNRPYDTGPYQPPQHQLYHTVKLLMACREIRNALLSDKGSAAAVPVRLIASGLSWLHQFAGQAAAGLIHDGWCDLAGFGRQAFAYPDFARDLLTTGQMEEQKCCLACGKCSEIMRDGGQSGCVIRDGSTYLPIYRQGRSGKAPLTGTAVAEHV
ncbi:MAG: flavin oxidoreductase/NADH oxidase [Bacillota bacterium]|nr:flavin oxidoreductase/NADH oxidase [Bacillota bacterium]